MSDDYMYTELVYSTDRMEAGHGRPQTNGKGRLLIEYCHPHGSSTQDAMGKRRFGCRWKLCSVICAILVYLGVFNLLTHSRLSGHSTWDPGGGGYVFYPKGLPRGNPDRFARLTKVRSWSCKKVQLSKIQFPLTALASYPGSGNTWVRHLIQQATGWATGSVYRDYALKLYGFPGEGVANSSVIVVKTHEWGSAARAQFRKCVLLVREPYGALLAEYNRRHAGHRGRAKDNNFGRAWREFVYARSPEWQEMILDWLTFSGKLLVLRYDKLKTDMRSEMKKTLKFLSVNATERDLSCMLKNSEGLFHRSDSGFHATEIFDERMRVHLDGLWKNISSLLDQRTDLS